MVTASMAKAPRCIVLGTAGHIDHGKTTLVHALTGIDTDRLSEEKRRGITIELGFAPLDLGRGLSASIVDVPGHEGFVRTMVAGASGIDVVLLAVSAVDGVMPQTREHLHICTLLGIQTCVVAVTMIDRLDGDAEAVELACEDIRETLDPTPFADAPIVPCSAVTGDGIDDLTRALRKLAAAVPSRGGVDRPILPIDRAFAMKGHGTVVTGTLLTGQLNARNLTDLRLVCAGPRRPDVPLRVRAMQVRNDDQQLARAGTRTALNLGGLALSDVHRGDVITCGHRVVRSLFVHALIEHLPHQPKPWEFGTTLQLCAGTAHCTATLDPLTADGQLPPGQAGVVRLKLSHALPTWVGQRVILRSFNDPRGGDHQLADAGCTVGGGTVVDPQPGSGRGQRTRWQQLSAALQTRDPDERIHALIDDAGVRGIERHELEARVGMVLEPSLLRKNKYLQLSQGRLLVTRVALAPLAVRACQKVDAFHTQHPTKPGMPRAVLEQQLTGRAVPEVVTAAIDYALEQDQLQAADDDKGTLARPGRGPQTDSFPGWIQAILDIFVSRGTQPPTTRELTTETGRSEREVFEAIAVLQRKGGLTRISREMSMASEHHERLLAEVREYLQRHQMLDMQAFKSLTGLSRKFAVPLMEHFDRLQITRRDGDRRVPGPRL